MKIRSLLVAIIIICGALVCNIYALPGFTPFIKDLSGQYVYYKDNTFNRDSYIGIITYDDATYGLRYYAPANLDKTPVAKSKDIQLLFTLDITKQYIELTGERIIGNIESDDTEIINYLHDIFYEFAARRKKAGQITTVSTIKEDYAQFGGEVNIKFNPLIPLFNIEQITIPDGTEQLKLITTGQLISSQDESFNAFKELPVKITDSVHVFKNDKKAKATKYSVSNKSIATQKITLDAQWTQSAENLWTLGKNAILIVDIIPSEQANSDFFELLQRKMCLGTDASYPIWDMQTYILEKNSSNVEISNVYYNPLSESFTKDFKYISKLSDGSIAFLSLTVFYGPYRNNVKYFEDILKSYKIEK